jgi:glycosyltransferase involved in cell wall biosynthesis
MRELQVPRVHQWFPSLTPGDAMGQTAVAWRQVLRGLGLGGEDWADEVAPGLGTLARPVAEFRAGADDLVLYHHGIASPLAGKLMLQGCRRAVVYHNITSPRAYRGTRLEEHLLAGRAQLAALAEVVELSIGVSGYNSAELEVAGHRNVHTVPLFVEPERFALQAADRRTYQTLLASGRPRLLSVSRVVPHKRVEDLLSLHAEVRRVAPEARLLVVGGYAAGHASTRALLARAEAVGGVTLMGRLAHAELVAAYRAADVYVSMSEHEGFGVPLVEAMAAEVPVLAFAAAAVPETLGGAGLAFDEKHFAGLAELALALAHDESLRGPLLEGQRRRLQAFSRRATSEALSRALAGWRPPEPPRRPPRRRPRVAVVVQRYGASLTGGAEAHARMVAQRLADHCQVEVLTSCARDHLTWANLDPPGEERDGRVRVHRFPVRQPRQMRAFNRLSAGLFGRAQDLLTEERWLREQGPLLVGLEEALVARRAEVDAFVFFTALYAPAVHGLPLVADRALLVPTAHDEPPLAFGVYDEVFHRPACLLCNTEEERAFIRRRFPGAARSRVVGVGVEALAGRPERFREAFGIEGPYLLYLGRLEAGKGVLDLVTAHQRVVRGYHDAPTLVLAGGGQLEVRGHKLVKVGRLDEATKWDALAGALAVVVPSRYESLSLVTLEAFAAGTPVLGATASEVVKGQLARSGAGVAVDFAEPEALVAALQVVQAARPELARRARRYAARFTWSRVLDAYLEELDRLKTR